MKNSRRIILTLALLSLMLTFSACTKKGPSDKKPSPADEDTTVALEDYWESPVLESEKGYYYNVRSENSLMGIHYVDKATDKDVFLCTKPECRHDGNEFCVATNKKYAPFSFQLYDGAIYAGAVCIEDNRFEVKLVKIALDGSSLSEVATIFTSNLATNSDPTAVLSNDVMILHRGKAFFHFCVYGNEQMEDTISYGSAIYDLNEKTTRFFNEDDPLSTENPQFESISARGDYFYYIIRDDKKRILRQYGLADGSDKQIELLTNFSGDYVVMNNGNIFYLRLGKRKLNVRYPDGTNKELGDFQYAAKLPLDEKRIPDAIRREWITPDVREMEYDSLTQSKIAIPAQKLLTDGETLFVQLPNPQAFSYNYYFNLPEEETDLMYYYSDPATAIDPETGRWIISVVDFETRLVSTTLDYVLPVDHKVIMTFDNNGENKNVLYTSVLSYADTKEYLYTFHPYVTKDKIYYEITESHADLHVNTRQLFVGESLEDLLSEKAFPDPFLIRDLDKKTNTNVQK